MVGAPRSWTLAQPSHFQQVHGSIPACTRVPLDTSNRLRLAKLDLFELFHLNIFVGCRLVRLHCDTLLQWIFQKRCSICGTLPGLTRVSVLFRGTRAGGMLHCGSV